MCLPSVGGLEVRSPHNKSPHRAFLVLLQTTTGGYTGNFVYKYYQDKGAKQSSFTFSPGEKGDILLHSRMGCQLGFSRLGESNIYCNGTHHQCIFIFRPCRLAGDMKSAKVVLLHKKNSKSKPEIYRPISNLTVVSKTVH